MDLFDFIIGLFRSDLNIVAMQGGGGFGPLGFILSVLFQIFKKTGRSEKLDEIKSKGEGEEGEGAPPTTFEDFLENIPNLPFPFPPSSGNGEEEQGPPEPEQGPPEDEGAISPDIIDIIEAGLGTGPGGEPNVPPAPPSQPPSTTTTTTPPKQKGFFQQILQSGILGGPSPADERRRMEQFNADQMEQRRLAQILREMQKERMLAFLDELKRGKGKDGNSNPLGR